LEPLFNWKLVKELFADFEHLGATGRAHALGGWAAILHGDGLGGFHFFLGATLNTITLHGMPPLIEFGC
jgi:hypothetical protein